MIDYKVVDPYTGIEHGSYSTLTVEALEDVLGTADRASGAVLTQRVQLLANVAKAYVDRRHELADIVVREMGKPVDQAVHEVEFSASIYQYYADNAAALTADEVIEVDDGRGEALVRRMPLGPVLGVMPWNYPYYQAARFAAPNLLIGNPVLLKPAPQCPESALEMQRIHDEAGWPAGSYATILASHEQVANLVADSRVHGVSVTGSERAGAALAETAGRHLKKVLLELGGSDPFILFSTDDLDATVYQAATARLENTGQACNAAKRYIVHDDIYDAFAHKLVELYSSEALVPSDPALSSTMIGPVSSEAAAARLADQLSRGIAQGARVLVGGGIDGNLIWPTILTNVARDNEIYFEEIFGPIAVLHRVHSEDEAVALANDTPYGLGAYVFSSDLAQAGRVAERLHSGMVSINLAHGESPALPFGGVKRSGFGRELGRFGVDEFVNKRLVRTAR